MSEAGIIRCRHFWAGLYTLAASLIWVVNTLFLLDARLSNGYMVGGVATCAAQGLPRDAHVESPPR